MIRKALISLIAFGSSLLLAQQPDKPRPQIYKFVLHDPAGKDREIEVTIHMDTMQMKQTAPNAYEIKVNGKTMKIEIKPDSPAGSGKR